MPRSKTGKTRAPIDANAINAAVAAVTASPSSRISLREACKVYNVKLGALHKHVSNYRKSETSEPFSYNVRYDTKKVFSEVEEGALVDYLQTCAKMNYGLSKKSARELAYKYAVANKKKYPSQWDDNEIAGEEWMRLFLKRHIDKLSLRKPEATSLSRATSFNRTNVDLFFKNLMDAHTSFGPIPPERIYNLDETGLSTVQDPPKVLSPKGLKQVGATTSAERGTTVTMICTINAIGNHIPPMLIFPRVNFKQFMLQGAPSGSIGIANPTGWTNENCFLQFLEHLINHTKPSKEEPILLVFDNHESHLSLAAIERARQVGIVMLTLPPHTSNKMQPLDRTVFGPFKTFYHQALDAWHPNNPGKTFDIYGVAGLVGQVYYRAFSTSNIISGFKATGIFPIDPGVFTDDDFLGSFVTDRPLQIDAMSKENVLESLPSTSETNLPDQPPPQTQENNNSVLGQVEFSQTSSTQSISPSTQVVEALHQNTSTISPAEIRPYPKAAPRKYNNRGRKPGRTRIITNTPEKEEIRMRHEKKQLKTKAKSTNSQKRNNKPTKRILQSDSEDDDVGVLVLQDSSDEDYDELLSDYLQDIDEFENEQRFDINNCKVGDFVLVQYLKKIGNPDHFIGEILGCDNAVSEYQVKFLKRLFKTNKFIYDSEEMFDVNESDIVMKLPKPVKCGTSRRQNEQLVFEINFCNSPKFNVK